MTNDAIYNNLMTILRKERDGKVITETQFNNLLSLCSDEIANAEYTYFERAQVITDSLRSLKNTVVITLTSGSGNFITPITAQVKTYWHVKDIWHAITGYTHRKIEIVSDAEYTEYLSSDLLQPTTLFPIAKITGDTVVVAPTSITSINFEYLARPTTPYFDYYHDANDRIKYLTPGAAYTLLTGETYTDKDDGSARTAGYTITSGENKSVELFLPEGERMKVLYLMLQKLGISLNNDAASQYGLVREQKEEVQ